MYSAIFVYCHQAAGVADEDGERAGDHERREGVAQIGQTLALTRLLLFDGGPEGRCDDVGYLGIGKTELAAEIIDDIGDDLGVGQKIAGIAEHLDEAAVCVVGRDLAVVAYTNMAEYKRLP